MFKWFKQKLARRVSFKSMSGAYLWIKSEASGQTELRVCHPPGHKEPYLTFLHHGRVMWENEFQNLEPMQLWLALAHVLISVEQRQVAIDNDVNKYVM